jgi:hypothetical protein
LMRAKRSAHEVESDEDTFMTLIGLVGLVGVDGKCS